jgi:hypothetical protein
MKASVYLHCAVDTGEVFYVGEGRPRRSRDRGNRNLWWRNKVAKHGGFTPEIVAEGISKEHALLLEGKLIEAFRKHGVILTNIRSGGTVHHWMFSAPRESHPMFGKRYKAPWIGESTSAGGEID